MPIKRILSRGEDNDNVNAYVIQEEEEQDDKVRYCESCKDNGYIVRLKKRLYLDDKGKSREPDSDADLWRQCYNCGNIYKITETKVQGNLGDIIEVDEPNSKEPHVQVLFSRKGRKGRLQIIRDTKSEIKDKEALQAIKRGEKIQNYDEYQIE